ncbi:MAG: RimK-like ATPgrasp N-terminal domain-containing protein [Methanoregula sp.]|nr:MAG: RimK-like ATPgrasp N-terminal domain-containing protein [Methanoregula sp.]
MNERMERPGVLKPGRVSSPVAPGQVQGIFPVEREKGLLPQPVSVPATSRKNGIKTPVKRDQGLLKDSLFVIRRNDIHHVISENYYYKTEPYYTILKHELEGKQVEPRSSAVLDAYVIPLCLERAASAGVPVCEWGISQAYVPLPAILYGLNYFSTTLDYFVINDNEKAKEVIRHITNNGKYPFCYQKYPEGSEISTCIAIFGRTLGTCPAVSEHAKKIYELFHIPLVKLVFIRNGTDYALSSLSPTRYAQLSEGERVLLSAYLANQEFL